jgi:hypothetical protein
MPFISNGTTILDNGAFSVSLGSLVHISTQTTSGATSVDFTSGINSTYPIYMFELINCTCSNNGRGIDFYLSTDGGSNYNANKTTTIINAYFNENGSSPTFQQIAGVKSPVNSGDGLFLNYTDGSTKGMSGTLLLFNPSGTTHYSHFMARTNGANDDGTTNDLFSAGYVNSTSAVNAVRFDTFDGNIIGTFKLYGIKDS